MKSNATKIQAYLLKHIPQHPHDIVSKAMQHFNTSRTTVLRHIKHLINNKQVIKTGQTKQITYAVIRDHHFKIHLAINDALDEFSVFTKYLDDSIKKFANSAAYDICEYGTTEMINNAKDHSSGTKFTLLLNVSQSEISISIADNGIGIFENILQKLNYNSYPELMLDLSKGKLTTDPTNHTGEGIFFTSRIFDRFTVTANGYQYFIDNNLQDWSFQRTDNTPGTTVNLEIARDTSRQLISIFKAYQDNDTLAFNKTDIKVELAKFHGERLISRSQAKRILKNLSEFNHVLLDFSHVVAIGQGFVDEIFRVYQLKHPEKTFDYCNANEEVEFMIKRSGTTR